MNKEQIDYKEYARQMRENAVRDSAGNVICSAELWEELASKIESFAGYRKQSEVDALTKENERLMREKNTLECIIATARNQGKAEAKTEIAREIFAAIEFDIHQLMFERDETRAIAIEGVIANLKKEYTEGEE